MPFSIGDKLGPYELLAPISKGGMGEVYRVKDAKLDSEDSRALVLALVAGPTPADHIEAGPLPLDEALAISKKIIGGIQSAR